MKRFLLFTTIVVVIVSIIFVGCSRVSADINEEVVFDKHPLLWGTQGIESLPLQEGSCVISPWTKVYKFTMSPVQYEEGFSNMITKDQTSVDLNAFLTLKIQKGQTPILLKQFGQDWYKNNVQERFREITRDKICSYDMLDLVGNRQIFDSIKSYVKNEISRYIQNKELPIDVESIVISKVEPSEDVRKEMDMLSIEAAKLRTEIQRLETEKARFNAEKARAKSDKVYMSEMGFTPSLYIDYLRAQALQNRSDILRIESVK